MSSEPSKVHGQTESTIGSAKQMAGQAAAYVAPETGGNLQQSGASQHLKGETETKAAETEGYVQGLTEQAHGKIQSVVGAVTGDSAKQAQGNVKEQKGEMKKDINNPSA